MMIGMSEWAWGIRLEVEEVELEIMNMEVEWRWEEEVIFVNFITKYVRGMILVARVVLRSRSSEVEG